MKPLEKIKFKFRCATSKSFREKVKEDRAYIELSNLYIRLERGDEFLTIAKASRLRALIPVAFPGAENEWVRDWWLKELQRLPRWNYV